MRHIIVPPVAEVDVITNPDGSFGKVTFHEFVRHTVLVSKMWRADDSWAGSACEVAEAVFKKEPGDLATLTDEDWERLKQVVAALDLNPTFAVYFLRFVKAITGATKNAPAVAQAVAEPLDTPAAG